MIQRIQTLFLLIAAGLVFTLFLTPMYHTINNEALLYTKDYTSLILTLVSFVLSAVAIATFKNRILQIRLCNLNTLILIGFQVYLAVLFFIRADGVVFSITAVFPMVAAIMSFIAMRYIARDEAMVIASHRLRGVKKHKK